MNLIEAVAESPISFALVIVAVAVAVIREIAVSFERGRSLSTSRQAVVPSLALLAVFVAVSATRVVLILR